MSATSSRNPVRFAFAAAIVLVLAWTSTGCSTVGAEVVYPVWTPPITMQPPPDGPPLLPPSELERIVSPIALYPDPLLAQVLAAATYPDDIPDAERWADDHHYLTGNRLTEAMMADELPWDPSVQALLPFPSVLEMMSSNMAWTEALGDAFLAQPDDVMDAVQRMRQRAYGYGYMSGCRPVIVRGGPIIEIIPADPTYITVPYYDPSIVFVPPRSGFYPPGGVYCGFGIHMGLWFGPWGWGRTRVVWGTHTVIINDTPWGRRWNNRREYVHPSPLPRRVAPRPGTPRADERRAPPAAPPPGDSRRREPTVTPPPTGDRGGSQAGEPRAGQPRTPDPHKAKPRTPKERAKEQPKQGKGDSKSGSQQGGKAKPRS